MAQGLGCSSWEGGERSEAPGKRGCCRVDVTYWPIFTVTRKALTRSYDVVEQCSSAAGGSVRGTVAYYKVGRMTRMDGGEQ